MQLARQEARRQREEQRREERSARSRMIAAIQITWKKIRPDLNNPEELREQRLEFMAGVLRKKQIKSSRDCTTRQLGLVLDAMREFERQPEIPGLQSIHATAPRSVNDSATGEGDIHHLATAAQVATIDKLFLHLNWSAEATEGFVKKRYQRSSHCLITPKQANSLTMILLNIAASRAIKDRTNVKRVSRAMVHAEIPSLKRRLGIDQELNPSGEEEVPR
jgi:hypothetical protein